MRMTKEHKKKFTEAIENGARVTDAAKSIGFHVSWIYRLRDEDEAFAKAWDAAKQVGALAKMTFFEKVADSRAVKGWLEPVYQGGKKVGYVRKFDNKLLLVRLKAEAKRAGDNSYVDRIDATSGDEKLASGLIVLPLPATDDDTWQAEHSQPLEETEE